MGYAIYERNGRDCGYGVPAVCDHPDCNERIDRGLANLCGEEPGGDEFGCGLYFCGSHLFLPPRDGEPGWRCPACLFGAEPFEPKTDVREWVEWKLTDESWASWRTENPAAVKSLVVALLLPPLPPTERTKS